ncbi:MULTISPECIES: WXG100 family type VII secretion target [Kitasatospora]|uniref:Uncharacterized protein YukE n=2 Tax=Kitasatospora TaxID=2063 RepID=A0ABT1J7D6_9ACTN|nr:WXG100 family type VII secretion target [Kitasatospora paracochleata]MCP2313347.1 uncharacterized protein YukE [Kitasatospora paracochleata]
MGLWDDVTNLAGDVVKVGEDLVMAPAQIAHWALGQMFGDADGELGRIAGELAELGKQVDGLGQEVGRTLGGLHWHGAAADAFTSHAQGRMKELNGVADELAELSQAVKRLADVL